MRLFYGLDALREEACHVPRGLYERGGKRALDLALGGTALLLLTPVMAGVWLAVRLNLGRPVLFLQRRSGRAERPFTIFKFRTMLVVPEGEETPATDAERLVPLGRLLRSTSLDELPELVNVLRGEMSLVGPRPLLERYGPHYRDAERKRFDVRPGITGWAQIRGRNTSSWDRRLADDTWYADNVSFLLDVRIFIATARQVLRGDGVIQDPRGAMLDLDQERSTTRP